MSRLDEFRSRKERLTADAGKEKQHNKGKLTARDRLDILLDEGSFVEIDTFKEGVVTGYGTIDDRLIFVYAQDFTVKGGSVGEKQAEQIIKVQELALKMGAPIIGLMDSGGARIQEGVSSLSGLAKIFRNNTISSGVIPQISVIMGPCAGGAVYSPALTDFIIAVDNTSQLFITGPEVIKTVTGEDVSAQQLGGAMTHNKISGVAHLYASDDEDALLQVRRLLSYMPSNNLDLPPEVPVLAGRDTDPANVTPAGRDATTIVEFETILPDNPNKSYDMMDIINLIADTDSVLEIMPLYAGNIITAFARLGGQTAGIIANQPKINAGCLDINASDKAARFIRFCDAFNIPLLTITDVPGFLPGTYQEYGGIIRHGAKMLYAYSEATVPKITLILRKAYGGAYIAMCNKELGADIVLAWPSAQIAVMGASGAANIVYRKEIQAADDPEAKRREKVAEYEEKFNNPYVAAERGYVDDVIEPALTRQYIINALDMLSCKREKLPVKKHGNIPL